ncbi:MAG: MFS transporter [Candidatus Omnitrophota bacterium]
MMICAVIICGMLMPFIWFALNKKHLQYFPDNTDPGLEEPEFSPFALLRSKGFFLVSANVSILPCVITGLFVYQQALAAEKAWPIGWLAACFIGYALCRAVFCVIGGRLVDRFSAVTLLPLFLIPFAFALLVITFFSHPIAALVYLALSGVAIGMSNIVNTAFLAEVYGQRHVGSIRAILVTIIVIATAIGPLVFGFLLDKGVSFSAIAALSALLVFWVAASSYRYVPYFKSQGMRRKTSFTA